MLLYGNQHKRINITGTRIHALVPVFFFIRHIAVEPKTVELTQRPLTSFFTDKTRTNQFKAGFD